MGNRRLHKIECLHTLGTPGSERLKVTALNLWEASHLSFDRPLPGKPPNILDRLSPLSKSRFFHITTQPHKGEGAEINFHDLRVTNPSHNNHL
jgi:hypothetical protein